MFLDLREIRRSGKDQQDFFFQYSFEDNLVDIPSVQMRNPIDVKGSITLTGLHSAYVEGEVIFTLFGDCCRCLKQTESTYSANFAEQVQANNQDGYSLVNDKVDLTKIVEDAILTNLPITLLCNEDCKGLCPTCGVNLNDEQCKCNKGR